MHEAEGDSIELGDDATIVGEGVPLGEVSSARLQRGAQIGRYVILERLGAGAMGVVYAAYDPELDRKIALKLLQPWREQHGEDASTRLLREAQAMAKLSHQNVITVHDVGHTNGRVFIAMEFVAGQTLGEWLRAQDRSWAEILDVFSRAGRGLAAAHEAGLVHRDFKPDNVLVGDDGRVRVLDFGLARPAASGEGSEPASPPPPLHDSSDVTLSASHSVLNSELTQVGARVGTPAYMSPEQHLGEGVGPASDQFSFCVALYEGLYARRPFEGSNAHALAFVVCQGKVREPPTDAGVPGWLWRVIRRGLSVELDARWPSMQLLLAQLRKDPRARTRRWLATAVATAALVGAGVGLWTIAKRAPTLCRGAEDHLVGIWDPERSAALGDALEATKLNYAADTKREVQRQLNNYAASWVNMRTETCEATQLRGEQSQELLDLRMACLDRRLAELDALVKILLEADAEVVGEAVVAASSLSPLAGCANLEALRTRVAPPTDAAIVQRVDELEATLATLKALDSAGRFVDGLPLAITAHESAVTTQYAPIEAEALYQLGRMHSQTGAYDDAVTAMGQAYWIAAKIGDESLSASAARELTDIVGFRQAKYELGLLWGRHAALIVDRAALGEAEQGWLRDTVGMVHFRAGEFELAHAAFAEALELREAAYGTEHPMVAASLNHVGAVRIQQAKFIEGRALLTRALGIRERLQGADHPDVAALLNNLGIVARNLEQYDDAIAYYERALAIREASAGGRHPGVAEVLVNLGVTYKTRGDLDQAERHYARAAALLEEIYGPDHPDVASALSNLGGVYFDQGDDERARAIWSRALNIIEAQRAGHPDGANLLINLGEAESRAGNNTVALEHYTKAAQIYADAFGPDHPRLGMIHKLIGLTQLELGDAAAAVRTLEESVRVAEAGEPQQPAVLAEARFALAQALSAKGEQRPRALELAQGAAELFAGLDAEQYGEATREATAWATAHR